MGKMLHEDLSRAIIGAAMEVLNALKPGLDEKLYERALGIELNHCGYLVTRQRPFSVHYRDELIGNLIGWLAEELPKKKNELSVNGEMD